MSAAKKKKNKKNVKTQNVKNNVDKKEEIAKEEETAKEEKVEEIKENSESKVESKQEEKAEEKVENNSEPKQEEKAENNVNSKQEEKQEEKTEEPKDKENKNEEKQDETKNSEKSTQKSVVEDKKSNDEKPEYVIQMLKNKKRKTIIFVCIVMLVLVLIAFSTFFALFNLNSTVITKGIKIKDIDVSGLTIDEAREKLNSSLETELLPELKLEFNEEYNTTLEANQIDFKYDVEDAIKEAYNIGREGNIIINNYTLLATTFFGKSVDIDYTYNSEFLDSFINDVNSKLPGLVVEPSYYIEEGKLIVSEGIEGIQVQKDKLKDDILNNLNSRNLQDVSQEGYEQKVNIPTENAKPNPIDMDKIYEEIHTEPQDAYFELDPYKIYPDVDGVDLAISVEDAKKQITGDKDEYEFDLKITPAEKTIDDLGTEAFPYLISSASTRYDASNTNRSTNLKIAADKINGKVLMPGEVFSFNKVVGKRTVEEGYRDAKIYADGGVVDGLAGGICQISSTLYNAVLLADLEIVERRNHSYTTSYIAAGRDATVVWGTTDFQFKNSRSYPIKIEASVKNGVAEFKMHGMQEATEYEIAILPQTTSSIPYSTTYIPDPALAPGQQIVQQAGHLGYKVTTYKVKKLNGTEVSREIISNDTYQPMRAIIHVGQTAPAPAPAPVPGM